MVVVFALHLVAASKAKDHCSVTFATVFETQVSIHPVFHILAEEK
jgi:hypothetical protein